MMYLAALVISFMVSLALTPLVRRLALRYQIVDMPGAARKIHSLPVPYLGGLAIVSSFMVGALLFVPLSRQLVALLVGGGLLALVGALDDVRGLSPWTRLGWQLVAAVIVLAGGIGIISVTNPLGGVIDLSAGRFAIDLGSLHFHITPIANFLTLLWLVGMVNTINFLDGLDGLASGVSAIAALALFALSINPPVNQPLVALLAIILAGAALGFLPFNFFPAKIFMGDSGAYFLGLTLALLAIYSGGKLATIGLVLGFTIIDAIWAAVRRLGRGQHPFSSDREHLHHLLLQAGLSQRRAVIVLYFLAAVLALIAVEAHSFTKFIALIILLAVMIVLIASLIRLGRRRAAN